MIAKYFWCRTDIRYDRDPRELGAAQGNYPPHVFCNALQKVLTGLDPRSGRHGFPDGEPTGSFDEACLGCIDGVCCLFGVEFGPQGDGPVLLVAQ